MPKRLLIRRLREAGKVQRCHIIPHYDDYTDGKHSFDAVSMLLVLHPDPSMNLVKAMLWHDMAERYVGDLPASAKFASAVLAMEYSLLEDKVFRDIYKMGELFDALTADDIRWIKAIDAMEFAMWCRDQEFLGNMNAINAYASIQEHIAALDLPAECADFWNYHGPRQDRLPERYDRS